MSKPSNRRQWFESKKNVSAAEVLLSEKLAKAADGWQADA